MRRVQDHQPIQRYALAERRLPSDHPAPVMADEHPPPRVQTAEELCYIIDQMLDAVGRLSARTACLAVSSQVGRDDAPAQSRQIRQLTPSGRPALWEAVQGSGSCAHSIRSLARPLAILQCKLRPSAPKPGGAMVRDRHSLSFEMEKWSEWRDSNPRPLVPQTSALTGLRYTPTAALIGEPLRTCNAWNRA
jgi:hypothetical protein